MSEITIPIIGKYVWDLVFQYDNSANAGSIVQEYELTISQSYTSKTFKETVIGETKKLVQSGSVKVDVGASYKAVSANVSASAEMSREVDNTLQETTRSETEETVTHTKKEKRSYTIGPNSKLNLYQRWFRIPGVNIALDVFRSSPVPLAEKDLSTEVKIEVKLAPQVFIKNIRIVEVDDAPHDAVRLYYKDSSHADVPGDVSLDETKKAWIVPEKSTKVEEAIRSITIYESQTVDSRYEGKGWKLPARGANRIHTYLVPVKDPGADTHINNLAIVEVTTRDRGLYVPASMDKGSHGYSSNLKGGFYIDPSRGPGPITFSWYFFWQLERAYVIRT